MITLNVSESTLELLRVQYRKAVEDVLDDPLEVNESVQDLGEYHQQMVVAGQELGVPFWEVVDGDDFIAKFKDEYLALLAEAEADPQL